ncbi:MAG: glycerol-3-phosphate 1-O-acyltransferase PlsY [Gammaproteobacteria bacterium]|jgi:glycerol-3-phosphate acyltransferase PlsY
MFTDILLVLGGYLFGSISTAIVTCKLMGLPDPRTEGSRNPGATNVLRFGGKRAGFFTLAGDMLKGVIPVVIAQALHASPLILAATGLAAFLGHLYPVFFGFQGGKGVATALGVLFGLAWPVGLAVSGIWLLMAVLFRISSLSALTAMLLAPLCFWWLRPEPAFIGVMVIITVMLFWRHRTNIRDLLAGREGKIGTDD